MCARRSPSLTNPSFLAKLKRAWLSLNACEQIFSVPSLKIRSQAIRSASAVVSWPQNSRLKMQWISLSTGFNWVELTIPPSSPSLRTPHVRRPAATLRSQSSTKSLSVAGDQSSATRRLNSWVQCHSRGTAYGGKGSTISTTAPTGDVPATTSLRVLGGSVSVDRSGVKVTSRKFFPFTFGDQSQVGLSGTRLIPGTAQ